MKAFVTGGSGLVGSRLLFDLARDTYTTIIASRRAGSNLTRVKKLFSFYGDTDGSLFSRISWVEADLLDYDDIEEHVQGCDHVFHCAAIVSFDDKAKHEMLRLNVEGTENLVNAALEAGVKKFCHVSSVAALGRSKAAKAVDENSQFVPGRHNSWYAISKYTAEREVWRASEEGLPVVIVNPSVIIGASDWNRSSGMIFKIQAAGNKLLPAGSTGFVDVQDVTRAMVTLMKSDIVNERFVVSAENVAFSDIFRWSSESFGIKPPTIRVTPLMASLGWRVDFALSAITGRRRRLTRDTADSVMSDRHFSSEKLARTIELKYTPVKEAVQRACLFFREENKI